MRNLGLLTASIAAAAVLAGCGGGGGGGSKQVTRTVAGFVYVLGGTGSATPDAVVLPTAVAPAGFFAPTAGTVTVSIPDGVISRAPDSETFAMTSSNAVICSVKAKENTQITISAIGLQFNGNSRSLSSFSVPIGVKANTNTVLTLNSGSTVYTPGPAVSLFYTIDGVVPTNPVQQFISGDGPLPLAVVSLDASGVVVSTLNYTVTASNAGVGVSGSPGTGPFDLTPGPTTQAEGTVDVTIDDNNANLQAVINGNFDHGTATTVTLATSGASVVWGTLAPSVPNTTVTLTATVFNQFGVVLPGEPVTFANAKAPANTWSASPGTWLTAISNSGNTNASGVVTATFNPPTEVNANAATGSTAKGISAVTATSGSATSTPSTDVTVLRPIGSLTAAGPARMDVGTSSPATGVGAYSVTGALDIDGDTATIPTGSITWTLTNTAGAGTIGNTGDTSPQSTGNASNSGNVVTAGTSAGQFGFVASIGLVNSNTVTTGVYGSPSKIVYSPNTAASVIAGAAGEYAVGAPGNTTNFSFTLLDSYGHDVTSETTFVTTSFIDSLTGGSITSGGSGVSSFTITAGPGDGLFRITANGTWTGTAGGSATGINLQRQAGHNAL